MVGVCCVNSQDRTYCRQFPLNRRYDHVYIEGSRHASQMSVNDKPSHKSNIPNTPALEGLALLVKETPVRPTSNNDDHTCAVMEFRKNVRVWIKPGEQTKITYNNVEENEARNMGYSVMDTSNWEDAPSNHNHVGGGTETPATHGQDLPPHTPSAGSSSTPARIPSTTLPTPSTRLDSEILKLVEEACYDETGVEYPPLSKWTSDIRTPAWGGNRDASNRFYLWLKTYMLINVPMDFELVCEKAEAVLEPCVYCLKCNYPSFGGTRSQKVLHFASQYMRAYMKHYKLTNLTKNLGQGAAFIVCQHFWDKRRENSRASE